MADRIQETGTGENTSLFFSSLHNPSESGLALTFLPPAFLFFESGFVHILIPRTGRQGNAFSDGRTQPGGVINLRQTKVIANWIDTSIANKTTGFPLWFFN